MFSYENYSIDVLSKSNAFVQNIKEVQPINHPTKQVPDLRNTIDCREDNAMKIAPSTSNPLTLHNAFCKDGGEGDRAGPFLSLPHVLPLSVISSSTLPSATTMGGATKSSENSDLQQTHVSSSIQCSETHCKWSLCRSQTPEHIPAVESYKARWGIMPELKLRGGGETATATSGWNNNNSNNTTATTTTPYGQPSSNNVPTSQAAAQWNANSSNSQPTQQTTSTGNTGLKPNSNSASGSQAPTSPSQAPQSNQPAGNNNSQPQTNGQSAGQSPAAQNSGGNGGSTWAQAAGKGLPATTPPTTSASTKQQLEQLNNMREALFSQDGWGAHVNQDSGWDIPSSPEPGQKDSNGAAVPPVWKPNVNNGTDLWETNLRNGGQPPPRVEKTTPWGSHTPASNIGGTWGVDDDVGENMWNAQGQWPAGPNQPTPPLWAAGGGPKKEPEWPGGNAANWGDIRGAAGGNGDPRDLARNGPMVDQRGDAIRNVMDQQHRSMVGGEMMRGDPRGISGRLNGAASEGMWPQQPPHHMPPAKPGVWPNGPPPKDKPNGWEEPSPPLQRRNIPNYDDGTSLWGTQQPRMNAAVMQAPGQNKVSHWKDLPAGGMGRGMPPGMQQNRLPPNDIKGNNPLWAHPRNGAWDGPHDMPGSGPWPEEKIGAPSWNDPSMKYKMPWEADVTNSWDHSKQPQKGLTKDVIWTSKQFNVLTNLGYKKEDVEHALRVSNMALEDALEMLSMSGGPNWRGRHSDIEPQFDHSGFPSQRFNPQQLPFAPPGTSGNGPNSSNQTLNPAIVQKIMTQQPPPQQTPSHPPTPYTQTNRAQQANQPSTQQLRMLVQQIQMAVQAGYLNHQILNQPLAPQTLMLLNQLLQHIKHLQSLMQTQHLLQMSNPITKNSNNPATLNNAVQITKAKQQITNLQNQIQAQQAVYVKQQQHQLPPHQGDFFNKNPHDPLSALPSNFNDLAIKDSQAQQSRLKQWTLPSLEKDTDLVGTEFSRAPGTTTKPSGGNSSPNLNPVLGQADGTWSRSNSEAGGWPETSSMVDDSKEWPNTTQANSQAFTDLVPEFEPGKPWKGTQMKSIEDDPSITPGSVVRSPLSLAATIKDTDIFSSGGKTSPTATGADMVTPSLSLSSNTWSFNPPSSTASSSSSFSSPLAKLGGTKSSWAESTPPGGNELWGAPNKPRGPPPGLTAKTPASNGWSAPGSNHWGPQSTPSSWAPNSPWLLLRNLTPQIDGSTLKTLCLQHGPLQKFHLYLNQGICLAKYCTRDEAIKAQGALNNCVLSNTSIYSEMLGENDVQNVLTHLAQQSSGGGGWGRGGGGNGGGKGDTWGTGWPPTNTGTSSLWSADPPQDPQRSTPSSLFLPGDLLGPGDSM